ncbi:MAG: hypothetical protein AAF638_04695 [Pseudomonadota bacterium]
MNRARAPFSSPFSFSGLAFAAAILMSPLAPTPAHADKGAAMIDNMVGKWSGSGKVTYTETWTFNFKCNIEGKPGPVRSQVDLTGKCWTGPLWSRMAAALRYNPKTRSYVGQFKDGTRTFVIDISGKRRGKKMNLGLKQGKQRGAMDLAFRSDDELDLKIALIHPTSKARRQVVNMALQRTPNKVSRLSD